ncbi:MAG TPA: type II secretion system ATPase GspE [Candidatus Babeliales bacterium]|nr:type II secretion system ATPase GspE [Candidatus Babeliales bacterium]
MVMKKKLGELLVAQGTLTEQQLHEAERAAHSAGQTLEAYLKEQKIVPAAALAQAYAGLVGAEYIGKITEKMADPGLLAKVPLRFLRKNSVVPIVLDGKVILVTANPLDYQPIDELSSLLGGDIGVGVTTNDVIIDAINRYYPLEGTKQMIEELGEEKGAPEAVDFSEIEEKDIMAMAAEAPIIKLVNHILVQAAKRGASDIHIEPFEKEVRVRYRIDGVMYNAFNPPKRIQAALASRIKIMANLNIAEKRIPQDGRIEIKVADKAIDIRVSILPVTFGERIVLRLLDKTRTFSRLKDLGFSEHDYKVIEGSIARPNGIIFVSGPTGSGKTSTLYSILSELNQPDVNIVTVEDPVEYQMPGIGQVQVKEKIGLTFAAALRSILRQDPDIIMIGEIRDQETGQIAIQAALTGHLVLSTIHTNNAPATITRLLDMGIEPYLIASSVVAILAQRLVRTLCPHCKKVYKPTAEEIESLGITAKEAATITFYMAVGCDECGGTGYKGRMAIFEVMEMSNEIAKLTMERADMSIIRKEALKEGMTMLVSDGLRRIKEGLTTIQEVVRVAAAEEEMIE